MKKKKIFIYGAGGLGREVLSLIKALPDWEMAGFIDDEISGGTLVNGYAVMGSVDFINNYAEPMYVIVAIGDPALKRLIISRIRNSQVNFPTLIHPSAILQEEDTIMLGKGVIIGAAVVLTTNIIVGDFVLLNLHVTIGHDCIIGTYSSLMPGCNISGNVTIHEQVLIGAGTNVRNKVVINKHATVGMGSVVLKDVDHDTVVAGVPARGITSRGL